MSRLWQYIAAGFAALASILGALFLVTINQRDRAKQKTRDAVDTLQAVKGTQSKERDIDQSRADARGQSAETQREHESRPADQRPGGEFRR